ncbi:MAG: hypothetical protein EOP45_08675 [Sphingobacteriaceae bacterium]|nr:MAG: hypothetical protein EOP45_08675 [Sphingobacteriaceae bacterium]
MSNELDNHQAELSSLLPYGEGLKPLLTASNLSEYDLKFLLQKRGVFVKSHQRNATVPQIASLLLSPKEFEVLRNRQHQKESNIKRSTSQSEWCGGDIKLDYILSNHIDSFIKKLSEEHSTYSLYKYNIAYDSSNKIIITGEIQRNDWTKDIFSIVTFHPWKLIIEKAQGNDTVGYVAETTVPETKHLIDRLQVQIHRHFQSSKVVESSKEIHKILATHFKGSHNIFEYLISFTQSTYEGIVFQRIVDIETGIDNRRAFPENFKWLKDNISELKLTALKGKKLDETDIIGIGNLGILVFGEIDAEFKFSFPGVSGKCIIQYGFPKFYEKRANIEFETKIQRIDLNNDCSHVSKEGVKRQLLTEFQKGKHQIFEKFRTAGKADSAPKNTDNQYSLLYPWAG